MPIEFTCGNEQCRKRLRAPNVQAGIQIECEFCGKVQIVPAGQGATITLTGVHEDTEEQAITMKPIRSAGVIDCGQCGRGILATDRLCPDCGWVNAELLKRLGPIDPRGADVPEQSLRLADCLLSPLFAFTNFRGLLVMVMVMLVEVLLIQAVIVHVNAFRAGVIPGLFAMFLLLEGAVELAVGGYVLRYHLNVIVATLVSAGAAPHPIELMFRKSIAIGVAGVEMMVVYVTPVITLPLLPLGLIALSQTDDERALDLRWALRAAMRHPAQLAAVWTFIAVWLAATVVLIRLLWPLAIGGQGNMLVGWLVCLLVPALVHPLICASSRCIGLMAGACPELIDSLPERPAPAAVISAIVGGIAVTYVVWGLVLPAIAG